LENHADLAARSCKYWKLSDCHPNLTACRGKAQQAENARHQPRASDQCQKRIRRRARVLKRLNADGLRR
jgi:hypothetical protein